MVLHGCAVEDRCLIGIGAIVLNGAKIGPDAVVAAGALVPEGMEVPPGMRGDGYPAKVRREVTRGGSRPDSAKTAINYVMNPRHL